MATRQPGESFGRPGQERPGQEMTRGFAQHLHDRPSLDDFLKMFEEEEQKLCKR